MRSAVEVADALGLTYRRLDYVCRQVLDYAPSSGKYRSFDEETVARLAVAVALANVCPVATRDLTLLNVILRAVLAGPVPPRAGWALLDAEGVWYAKDAYALVPMVMTGPERVGGIIAYYEVP